MMQKYEENPNGLEDLAKASNKLLREWIGKKREREVIRERVNAILVDFAQNEVVDAIIKINGNGQQE